MVHFLQNNFDSNLEGGISMAKQPENKRQAQASKLVEKTAKPTSRTSNKRTGKNNLSLREQYKIIRDDISKLKSDLNTGYEMAKGLMDRKSLWRGLMGNVNK
jgi:hypothetical protein